ncbi:MAG: ATP-binding protein involved in chromosome partitioning, partial [Porticoccus sp.]
LGIVENMAVHSCSECGHQEHIFGEGGGQKVASEYNTEVLGALPLSLEIRRQVDAGKPSVIAEPKGYAATAYVQIASKVATLLAGGTSPGRPEVIIE